MSPRTRRLVVAVSIPFFLGGCARAGGDAGAAPSGSISPSTSQSGSAGDTAAATASPPAPVLAPPTATDPDIGDATLASWTTAQGNQVPVRTLLHHTLARVQAEKRYLFTFAIDNRLTNGAGDLEGSTRIDTTPAGAPQRAIDLSYSGSTTLPTWAQRVEYLQVGDGITYVTSQQRPLSVLHPTPSFRATPSQLPQVARDAITRFSDPTKLVSSSYDVPDVAVYSGSHGTGTKKTYTFIAGDPASSINNGPSVHFSVDGQGRLTGVQEFEGVRPGGSFGFLGFGEPNYIQAPPAYLVRPIPAQMS